jgi:anti-sigma regulatory factor (Ser/Thr protein kinase)
MTTGFLLGVADLVGTPGSVSYAREYVRSKLGERHPALDDVTLLVSEVVTNAVIHSNSRNGGKVTLAIADCHEFIHVDVVDAGSEGVPRMCGDTFAEGGRGLMLVDQLSRCWGVHEDGARRAVWFQVAYRRGGEAGSGVYCPRQGEPS